LRQFEGSKRDEKAEGKAIDGRFKELEAYLYGDA